MLRGIYHCASGAKPRSLRLFFLGRASSERLPDRQTGPPELSQGQGLGEVDRRRRQVHQVRCPQAPRGNCLSDKVYKSRFMNYELEWH